jgi:exosortase family protein XrtM
MALRAPIMGACGKTARASSLADRQWDRLPTFAGTGRVSLRRSLGWQFLLLFVALYLAMYVAYVLLPDAMLRDKIFSYGITYPAKAVLNWLFPGERAVALENQLRSARAHLSIVRGCDGAGVVFLLIAAIVAYRAAWMATLLGTAGAIGLIYLVNEMRIVALYFVQSYRPLWFMTVHVYFIPSLMILVAAIYFMWWAARCEDAPRQAQSG